MGGGGRWAGFDWLRVLAASAVVLTHAFYLSGHEQPVALMWEGRPMTWGLLAVSVFFAASGFLVARSWESDPSVVRFAARRITRIWPALIVVTVGCALVLGPVMTAAPPTLYFTQPETWRYLVWNLLMLPAFYLPWVFHGNPDAVVNGSLWSLPIEVGWYAVLAALGLVGVLRRTWWLVAVTALVIVAAWMQDLGVIAEPTAVRAVGPLMLPMGALFLTGAVLARLRVAVSPWWALAVLAALIATRGLPVSGLAYVGIAFVVVALGTSQRGAWLHRWGDPSYGIFLWGWPLTQVLVQLGVVEPLVLLPSALAAAVVAGYVSWRYVEQPVMARTRRALRSSRSSRGATSNSQGQPMADRSGLPGGVSESPSGDRA